ncbi:hypothetical protein PLICRDRAFT_50074 [Plicaturopsis crispa FD-325 SS-3]|nr:hypothetical protein PLICRDRAFT_50074 [Plicaturopsis crispa FD-325 SS-3]
MEIFAGSVSSSDAVFMNLVETIDTIIGDESAPASTRHLVLQLAVIFMCGISQLSPGAYFLRRDLFPSLVTLIKSPETAKFTFEAILLLGVLSNYHKSEAAKLNPYIQSIRESTDKDLMRQICWASNFAADAAIKAYQEISDDSPPTLATTFGSLLTSLRPDRALASKPVDPPRELFKNQPIEATVVLLPIFEILYANATFGSVLAEYVSAVTDGNDNPSRSTPPPFTFLTLSSYILTHASSLSSPRAIAYASLSLNILLALAENDELMDVFCKPAPEIRLCRQRLPLLPWTNSPRPPMCALLNCCVLWLRHNLHMRLEVYSYITCIRVCYRVLWFLQKQRIRLVYDWKEYWGAVLGVLNFLASKLDSLVTTGGIEQLVEETVALLDLAMCKADTFLPTPQAVHEFIYELVRSSAMLRKQSSILQSLANPRGHRRSSSISERPRDTLAHMLATIDFYEDIIAKAGARSAKGAMQTLGKQIDSDGLHGVQDHSFEELPKNSAEVLGFIRYACADGLSLMP